MSVPRCSQAPRGVAPPSPRTTPCSVHTDNVRPCHTPPAAVSYYVILVCCNPMHVVNSHSQDRLLRPISTRNNMMIQAPLKRKLCVTLYGIPYCIHQTWESRCIRRACSCCRENCARKYFLSEQAQNVMGSLGCVAGCTHEKMMTCSSRFYTNNRSDQPNRKRLQ